MVRLLFALMLFAVLETANAAPAFPPGMRIGLEPAGDLKPAPGGTGFQDTARDVSVLVAEMPLSAFETLQRAVFGEPPAGATQVTRESFPFKDGIGFLHTARAVEKGVPTLHWVLLAQQIVADGPAPRFVALINVSVPESARDIYSDEAVRRMLASVTFRPPPIKERLALIPFKLDELAGFRVVQVRPDGVVLTEGPSDDIREQPHVIVSIGRAPGDQGGERQRFSRDMMLTMPLHALTIRSAENMRIGGRAGNEIRASAKDSNGTEVSVVQWIKFAGGAYLRVAAVSPSDNWDQMFNRFRAVRDGVDLR
jgi:hypothetical protein